MRWGTSIKNRQTRREGSDNAIDLLYVNITSLWYQTVTIQS